MRGQLTYNHCADVSGDGNINVVDIVKIATCVLQGSCGNLFDDYPGMGDFNGDNAFDVLDIFGIANCVLIPSCECVEDCTWDVLEGCDYGE